MNEVEIQRIWNEFKQSPELVHLRSLLERIETLINNNDKISHKLGVQHITLNIFKLLIEAYKKNKPVFDLSHLTKKAEKQFENIDWQVDTVNQAETIQEFYQEIYILLDRNKEEILKRNIPVWIVLVVMNISEATEVLQNLSNRFENNQAYMDCYGNTAQSWKPYRNETSKSIQDIINEHINELNRDIDEENQNSNVFFSARYVDIQQINENRKLLRKIREELCFVVIDPISMKHPNIQKSLQLSSVDGFYSSSLLMFSDQNWVNFIRQMDVNIRLNMSEVEVSRRRYEDNKNKHEYYSINCEECDERNHRFATHIKTTIQDFYLPKPGTSGKYTSML